ncbi:MAG: YtxH domain-containing protein [Muribaculaceae bacterium]|nr:YtxH domain-containing protein [Muribaculaceae bacterium]
MNSNVTCAVAALFGGLVIGAALGVAFAPKAGRETRDDIRDYVRKRIPGIKKDKLDLLVEEIASEMNP